MPQGMPQQMPPQPYPMQGYPTQYGYAAPQQKKTLAIVGLVSAILALILYMIELGLDVDVNTFTSTAKELKSNCSTWFVLFWIGLAALAVAIVMIVMCFVKKSKNAVVITALVIASIALIMFFVNVTKYSDVSDSYDIAERYAKYEDLYSY